LQQEVLIAGLEKVVTLFQKVRRDPNSLTKCGEFMNRMCLLSAFVLSVCAGCAIQQEVSRTPRTAVEQVLLTQAIERALSNLTVQLPEYAMLHIDATSLDTDRSLVRMSGDLGTTKSRALETAYVRDSVSAALARKGYRTLDGEATFLVRVMIESLGTMQGMSFFGMPPIQSVLIPFALPELTLYKLQKQSGYARLHLDLYDNRTRELIGSSATLIGRTYYDQYTVLFYITWYNTDLMAAP
jgi:hypothetical protein